MASRKLLGVALAVALVAPAVGRAVNEPTTAVIGGTAATQMAFGLVDPNPTGIKMYYYVPSSGTAPMPIVLGLHSCQGNQGQIIGWLKAAADKYGFMLAIPFANRIDQSSTNGLTPTGCWDVGSDDTFKDASNADPALRSNSDPKGVYALVKYVGTQLKCGAAADAPACGDLARVYVTGQSSGGMMTNVMLGMYPELFKAGAAAMGVAYGCWAKSGPAPTAGTETTLGTAASWNNDCQNGKVTHTPAEWAALLPTYPSAQRARVLVYQGEADDVINFINFGETVKQWTQALGVGQTPSATEVIAATKTSAGWTSAWTRKRYGGAGGQAPVETLSAAGVKHALANDGVFAEEIVRFFGLGDETAPAVPTALAASAVTTDGATLTWTAPADTDLYNYVVSRVDGSTLTAVGWPTAANKTVTLTGLSADTSYTFQVVAADKAGNASPVATVQLTTAKAPSSGGGGGGGCGQGVPSGAALLLAAAALLLVRRRTSRA